MEQWSLIRARSRHVNGITDKSLLEPVLLLSKGDNNACSRGV
jgi:hypothetical protein